jgi:hypothetical protein
MVDLVRVRFVLYRHLWVNASRTVAGKMKNANDVRELVSITAEFFISLVVLIGGGFLLYTGNNTEAATSAITAVVTFWFIRRQSEQQTKSTEKLLNAQKKEPTDPPQ